MPRIHRGTGEAWLRGGQTLSHTVDMILEVLGKLAIPAVLWGVFCICLANSRSGALEQTYGLQALQAKVFDWDPGTGRDRAGLFQRPAAAP
jgi:hypothetical protein